MAEIKLEEVKLEVKNLKISLYSLIDGFRKLIHIAQMEQDKLIPLCKVTTSIIDEKGTILVGKDILQALSDKIVAKCLEESENYISLFYSIDRFILGMLDYMDIIKVLHSSSNDRNMKLLCECWCGDKYDGHTKKNGLKCLSNHFNKLTKELSIEMFKNLFYEIEKEKEKEEVGGYFNIFEEN